MDQHTPHTPTTTDAIEVTCPCGAMHSFAPVYAGRIACCPQLQRRFQIPAQSGHIAFLEADSVARTTKRLPLVQSPAPQPTTQRAESGTTPSSPGKLKLEPGAPRGLFLIYMAFCPLGIIGGVRSAASAHTAPELAMCVGVTLTNAAMGVCAVGAYKWKRWGVYGVFVVNLLWLFVNSAIAYSLTSGTPPPGYVYNPQVVNRVWGGLTVLSVVVVYLLIQWGKYIRPRWKKYS
jgi:hypothetical protein